MTVMSKRTTIGAVIFPRYLSWTAPWTSGVIRS
jgi:hypothetical protein